MRRIIYTSRAAPDLDRAELIRLLYRARIANEGREMSGVLIHAQGRFLQVIEGHTWKLLAAFENIRRDPRHMDVEVLWERSIARATFPSWPMRYFDERNIGKAIGMMTVEAGGTVPEPIAEALRDFLVQGFIAPASVSPSPLQAASPSSPRLC